MMLGMGLFKNQSKFEFGARFFVGAILLSPFVYVYFFHTQQSFWDNMFGNLLATSLALVAGVPVGLWVDRYIKEAEMSDGLKTNLTRERDILVLLKEELEFSLNSIFLPARKGNTVNVQIQPYKMDLWNSLVASEQVKYIDSPELLNRITSAYYAVKLVNEIEMQAYLALRTSAISFTNPDGSQATAASLFLKDARKFDEVFEQNVSVAVANINDRLQKISEDVGAQIPGSGLRIQS